MLHTCTTVSLVSSDQKNSTLVICTDLVLVYLALKRFGKEGANSQALMVAKGPEVLAFPLFCDDVCAPSAVNISFLQQNNVILVYTEPFEYVCSFLAILQAPHVEENYL